MITLSRRLSRPPVSDPVSKVCFEPCLVFAWSDLGLSKCPYGPSLLLAAGLALLTVGMVVLDAGLVLLAAGWWFGVLAAGLVLLALGLQRFKLIVNCP